jgi:hypothetical protein
MLEKERAYVQQIESLHEHMRRMQKFVHTLIKFNNNNNNNNNHHVKILFSVFFQINFVLLLEYISTYGRNITK